MATNVVWHRGSVTRAMRRGALGQDGCVVWFTGLSGSGKSTIAHAVEARLVGAGRATYVLDGDNVRHGLCEDLGFSDEDRRENIRRLAHLGALFRDAGVITLTAFISPFRADRDAARARVEPGRFFEVFVDTPLSVCEERDPKGLYKRARAGEISHFTGISSPYEAPAAPEVHLNTAEMDVPSCVDRVLAALGDAGVLGADAR